MSEKPQRPFWVTISLTPFSSRAAQWFFVWLSLAAAIAVAIAAFGWHIGDPFRGFVAIGVCIAVAAIYWLTIRWMDVHNAWDLDDPRP